MRATRRAKTLMEDEIGSGKSIYFLDTKMAFWRGFCIVRCNLMLDEEKEK